MYLPLCLSLLLLTSLTNAALFSPTSSVKPLIGAKSFKKALAQNRTAIFAFVAPWCGHCQKLVPEYEKAAKRLTPLVPLYAVDCDNEVNKRICAEQGVKGFPTMKIFKTGKRSNGIEYQGARNQNAIYNWAKSGIPDNVNKVKLGTEAISEWQYKSKDKPRAILFNKTNKLPLMWVVLANQFSPTITFANTRDRRGLTSKAFGFKDTNDDRKPKVVLYRPHSSTPILYEGLLKYEPLSKFFAKFAKGGNEAELDEMLKSMKTEKDGMDDMEMRIQEAEAIMQGKGYGNPHAGMDVNDDGTPKGNMHEGHGGGDYLKMVQEEAAKREKEGIKKPAKEEAVKVEEKTEANFDDVDLSDGDEMGEGENYDGEAAEHDEL